MSANWCLWVIKALARPSSFSDSVNGTFSEKYKPTNGAVKYSKAMKLASTGGIFTFEIWDISGNEMFHNLANVYFRDADAIFLIFDCTKKESMRSLRENWVQEIKEKAPESVQLLVLGNKSDLNEEEGQVSTKELSEFASQCGARYKFVSAKTAENLSDVF
eukprot:CAMPEP_0202959080 /NCGR_PEP_ID=MMETSP1396-20130829/3362_1 /ASSEMBLY_ACC=CAM_ASM_000872 /TAXON_ID= /ORGANISM="Pseudokeronopsis sp., Strain Brazil" /LENGTH=160 /DNA_ID=CAMNT_0049677499 /DNA_START=72 /DNA_END=553 /DNA_ORIENTATION=-